LQQFSVSTDFALVPGAEAVDLEALEHLSDLFIAQLGPFDAGAAPGRFDRGDLPQVREPLGADLAEFAPLSLEFVDFPEQASQLGDLRGSERGWLKRYWQHIGL